ncbi:hypothetical protein POKO110462_18825 [Pontibacter korlensis]|uniref:Collagen-like protein n=1 Tax=Pontibacter korlensis TaxID=400092 RepID=A0A0E3ZD46_9BACT|nr:hypothetical protein [Pontibacter korlensis]AKD02058.1 hypothetical protein PKOR_01520 [Pontibacter korlensis]
MKIKLLPFIPLLLTSAYTHAQNLSKLEVGKKDIHVVTSNILQIDTLIMHDKSTLLFPSGQHNTLKVKYASIADNCTISSAGTNGKAGKLGVDGENGTDAGGLDIDVHLVQLGSLTVDTRGGSGGNGYRGKNGRKPRTEIHTNKVDDGKGGVTTVTTEHIVDGTAGEQGTAPGVGGNGGDITFRYSTGGFIPNFNRSDAKRSIFLLYQAGKTGKPGRDGISYGRGEGRYGTVHQTPDKERKDGKLLIEKRDSSAPAAAQ